MRVKARKLEVYGSKTTSNFLPGFGKILSNSRADPKIWVAYKKTLYIVLYVHWSKVGIKNFLTLFSISINITFHRILPQMCCLGSGQFSQVNTALELGTLSALPLPEINWLTNIGHQNHKDTYPLKALLLSPFLV